MLVIALSNPFYYVDTRPLVLVSDVTYTSSVLLTAIALFGLTVFAVAHLLIDDYLIVLASKGQKLTIAKRVVRFIKDYKSEVKKIVWPGPKSVIKNTVVVLAVCLVIGIVIWLVDFGLGNLLNLIWGK
ncbi:MAG: preprotein translocase subunit SecE [Clostridia bacterium]|nr:preprotein translocase subunit SecE [Clostridia bacterium]